MGCVFVEKRRQTSWPHLSKVVRSLEFTNGLTLTTTEDLDFYLCSGTVSLSIRQYSVLYDTCKIKMKLYHRHSFLHCVKFRICQFRATLSTTHNISPCFCSSSLPSTDIVCPIKPCPYFPKPLIHLMEKM